MDNLKLKHLVTRIVKHDDQRAFSEFFDSYHTRLVNLAMLFVPRYTYAEDIVSDVFLSLLSKKERLLELNNINGYLFILVKNRALDFLKSRKNEFGNIIIDDIQDYLTSDFIEVERKMTNDEIRQKLNESIQALPPKRRLVFKMIKDEGLSYRETAEILEISERTVEVHLKLAIQDLRKVLQSFYDEYKDRIPLSKQRFLSLFL